MSENVRAGAIIASCGHKVASCDDLVSVTFKDEVVDHDFIGFVEVDVLAVYCPPCAAALAAKGTGDE